MKPADRISSEINEAIMLLKENCNYRYGEVDLNKAIIVASYLSEIADCTVICGMKVYLCDLQSSFDYFICIPDATKAEEQFLRFHREAMEKLNH